MKNLIIIAALTIAITSCKEGKDCCTVKSPNDKTKITFKLDDGKPFYSVKKNGTTVLNPSALGFVFSDGNSLCSDFEIKKVKRNSYDKTWQQPWGEEVDVRENYNEMIVCLQDGKGQLLNIVFRVFNDGVGFRYEIPQQPGIEDIEITDELTEFAFAEDMDAWTQPLFDRDYEKLYTKRKLSEINDTVSTPVTIETPCGKYIAIHEAALIDYAKMNLFCAGYRNSTTSDNNAAQDNSAASDNNATVGNGTTLKSTLTPWSTGIKVYAKTPLATPWRTIILADNLNKLVNSRIMLNLNEPCKVADVTNFKPSKYVGIWWGMHQQTLTWTQGSKHGATTENMKRYIDFAAENGFDAVLVEGWNIGWDGYMVGDGTKFLFDTPYSDFDIEQISGYAKQKGISIIGHNETAGATVNYEQQLEKSFEFDQKYDIRYIKTGYVNLLLDDKERHSSQYGVRHYRKVVETAAKYGVVIDIHEPIMPTGWQRTYPNLMAQEGVRGQEWDAWSADGGNPPEHTTIIPFTRALAGPIDFTPGTFNFNNPVLPGTRVQTTLAKQLALYVVIYSPLQMASDLPENYENNPAPLQFIKDVPVDWQKTMILDGKIGDYVITARKDKHSDNWYIGAITDENAREVNIKLNFLDKNTKYTAKIYKDGKDANWKTNPYPVEITTQEVDRNTVLPLHLAESGGA
ncbi:MAG: glycoside hydrolase family 97 protein, partial [Bacteroidales bacterium]|nr:glycoside hydrolase family 97 protein [Bacteroidales bacterium]